MIIELLKIQRNFGADLAFDNILFDEKRNHTSLIKGDLDGDYVLICSCDIPPEPHEKKSKLTLVK